MTSWDRASRRAISGGLVAILAGSAAVDIVVSPRVAASFAVFSLLTWCWVAIAFGRARIEDPTATLGIPTYLTLLRGLLVSLTAGFVLVASGFDGGVGAWLPGLLYLAAVLTDRYDGIVARRSGQVTKLGALLDVAMDGLGLLVAPVVAVAWRRLPPWYLLVGGAYYLFHGGMALRRRAGLPVFPERLRPSRVTRFFAGVQMVLVAVALLPLCSRRVNAVGATLLMLPTLGLFVRDWLVVIGRRAPGVTSARPSVPPLLDPHRPLVERKAREESLAQ